MNVYRYYVIFRYSLVIYWVAVRLGFQARGEKQILWNVYRTPAGDRNFDTGSVANSHLEVSHRFASRRRHSAPWVMSWNPPWLEIQLR